MLSLLKGHAQIAIEQLVIVRFPMKHISRKLTLLATMMIHVGPRCRIGQFT